MKIVDWFVKEMPSYLTSERGWGNGYIAIPPEHPYWGLEYHSNKLWDIDAHGGFTYAGRCVKKWTPENINEDWWMFGFDTSPQHIYDTQHNWSEDKVKQHTEYLAFQFAAAFPLKLRIKLQRNEA